MQSPADSALAALTAITEVTRRIRDAEYVGRRVALNGEPQLPLPGGINRYHHPERYLE